MALASWGLSRRRNRAATTVDGWVHPAFAEVATTLKRMLRKQPGGGAVCVYHRGDCVVDLWGGRRDRAGTGWDSDTLAPSFSTSKGVASTLVHIMVDRGLLDYDDRVADHWPEFARAGKEDITIRQVLTHQAGLYHIRRMVDRADRMLDWEHMIAAIEASAPIHKPGERSGYHGFTYGYIVGEIVQRVTGKRFSQLVQDEIAAPLGLDGMYIGAPEKALPRVAELMWPRWMALNPGPTGGAVMARASHAVWRAAGFTGPVARATRVGFDVQSTLDALAPNGISAFDFGAAETLRAVIPSGNGLFTARSLARMYAALAGGGEIDGVRLISRKTLVRAMEVQTRTRTCAVIPFDMRWRLGYHVVGTTRGILPYAFGHFGFGGSGAWADPTRDLAIAMTVNSGMGTPFGDLRMMRLGTAALGCADVRSGATAPQAEPAEPELVPQRATA